MQVKVKLNHPAAQLPTRGSSQAAGLDLYASESMGIGVGEFQTVDTGISIELPEGTVGLIWPRSGLSVKHGIDVLAGVIDSDYRGSIKVCLANHGEEYFKIDVGDRIAQLVIQEYVQAKVVPSLSLDETNRGAGGFGSTGV